MAIDKLKIIIEVDGEETVFEPNSFGKITKGNIEDMIIAITEYLNELEV